MEACTSAQSNLLVVNSIVSTAHFNHTIFAVLLTISWPTNQSPYSLTTTRWGNSVGTSTSIICPQRANKHLKQTNDRMICCFLFSVLVIEYERVREPCMPAYPNEIIIKISYAYLRNRGLWYWSNGPSRWESLQDKHSRLIAKQVVKPFVEYCTFPGAGRMVCNPNALFTFIHV